MRAARARGCELIVYTECALSAFFAHWWIEEEAELDAWYEREMPGPATQPLFDEAARLGIGFHLGYAELAVEGGTKHRYNSSVLVGPDGRVIGKYRKIHLPGHVEHRPGNPFQNLEKRYFEVGDLGFPAWRAFGASSGCASATTGAGRRLIACWPCKAPSSSCSATIRRRTFPSTPRSTA